MLRLVLIAAILASSAAAQNNPEQEEWVQLFNGKDLTGWTPKITGYAVGQNFGNTFRVKDGLLEVGYEAYDDFHERFGHLFYENEKYGYYRMRVEYRFVGDQAKNGPGWARRNSGIMIHGQPASTMGVDQDFPVSIEVQLLGGLSEGPRTTLNLCTPGTNVVMDGKLITKHCVTADTPTFDGEQWVTAEVLALGSASVRHILDGKVVIEYELPQIGGGNVDNYDPKVMQDGKLLERGSISLQSESHPVQFRKVELLDLEGCMDPKAKNYKKYFVKADNTRCEY
ncbi:MAG: DUF1080 domain-containing protein [Bryobacterales bacterium]|nr:DUF1080 domain-containing protein [Bryobacterales bacterium]